MSEIIITNITKKFGDNLVLDNISLVVNRGDRIGLVGRNGSGKTTLFKIIAGLELPDKGSVSFDKGTIISYQEQTPVFPEEFTCQDVLCTAVTNILDLKKQLHQFEKRLSEQKSSESDTTIQKYGELLNRFEAKGGYELETRLNIVCTGLHISEDMLNRPFVTLSGGEKTTILLGMVLYKNPNVLLLDEPTNHLDIEAIEWLEDYLKNYQGTVLLISHDRYFLDRTVTKIVELDDGKLSPYIGTYSDYIRERDREVMKQFEAFKDQQKKIKAMREAIHRFREWGRRSDDPKMFKKAFNMEKRIERMVKIERPRSKKTMNLTFVDHSRSGDRVVSISGLSKSYDTELLQNLSLNIINGEVTCLLGRNGSGKSTLFKSILGFIKPDQGTVTIGSQVRIGYLEQEITFEEDNISLLDLVRKTLNIDQGKAWSILARFLFYKDDVFKFVNQLSGGEKVRLKLCLLTHQPTNFLLLDEPTNHLDIESREIVEDTLKDYQGTILFISHDRYFINKLAGRVIELIDGHTISYHGNYDYYRTKKNITSPRSLEKNVSKRKIPDKKMWQDEKSRLNKRKANQTRLTSIEKEIEKHEKLVQTLENEMALNPYDYDKLTSLQNELDLIREKIEGLYQEWERLSTYIQRPD